MMRMYFTNVATHEAHSGVAMRSLNETEAALQAIGSVTGRALKTRANTVVATLASGRTWSTQLPNFPRVEVYINPRPDGLYAIGFTEEQGKFEPALAAQLERGLGTASITLSCALSTNEHGEFMLDANLLLRILAYAGQTNDLTADGNALSTHVAYSAVYRQALYFTNEEAGLRLLLDDTYLGPLTDAQQRPLRTAGFGIVRGLAYADCCCLDLVLTSTHGQAFDTSQQHIRHYAGALANLVSPAYDG